VETEGTLRCGVGYFDFPRIGLSWCEQTNLQGFDVDYCHDLASRGKWMLKNNASTWSERLRLRDSRADVVLVAPWQLLGVQNTVATLVFCMPFITLREWWIHKSNIYINWRLFRQTYRCRPRLGTCQSRRSWLKIAAKWGEKNFISELTQSENEVFFFAVAQGKATRSYDEHRH